MKFFRNIRQRFINNKKIGNYLFYAIGEIILVVVGILIALQINNWNENQKLRTAEKSLYLNIMKDLDKEYQVLKEQLNLSEILKVSYRKIHEFASGTSNELDLEYPTLLFQSINFNSLVLQNYEKSVDQITSDSLRSDLNEYLITAKELSTRRREEVEEIKTVRRPFILNNNIVDLDKLLYDNSELASINLNSFKETKGSEDYKRFITSGYASNQALIYHSKYIIDLNRALKIKLENSELLNE